MLTKNTEVDMLIDEIRRTPAKVLTEEQREAYWKNGYLLLERLIPEEWLERLRAATAEMVERSRALTASDRVFDLEPDHTAAATAAAPGHEPGRPAPGLLGLRP